MIASRVSSVMNCGLKCCLLLCVKKGLILYGVESMLPMKSKATALLFTFGLYVVIFMHVQEIGLHTWIVILHMRSQPFVPASKGWP